MKKVVIMSKVKPKNRGKDQSGRRPKTKYELAKESLAFKVLTASQTKEISNSADVHEIESKVMGFMSLEKHAADLQVASLLDYYTAALWWAKEQVFTDEQLSAFFSVVHTLLENVKEKQLSMLENLCEFKKMLIGIGQEMPDITGGLICFNVLQAKSISEYIYISLFQHYKMYEFMFGHTQAQEIIGTDLDVEVALPSDLPWPPPLDEGVPIDVYNTHIATPPPTPPQESSRSEEKSEVGESTERGVSATSLVDQKEADLLTRLSPEDVKTVIKEVFTEMIFGLQADVAQKLREKETAYITRINKIHKVADK